MINITEALRTGFLKGAPEIVTVIVAMKDGRTFELHGEDDLVGLPELRGPGVVFLGDPELPGKDDIICPLNCPQHGSMQWRMHRLLDGKFVIADPLNVSEVIPPTSIGRYPFCSIGWGKFPDPFKFPCWQIWKLNAASGS